MSMSIFSMSDLSVVHKLELSSCRKAF